MNEKHNNLSIHIMWGGVLFGRGDVENKASSMSLGRYKGGHGDNSYERKVRLFPVTTNLKPRNYQGRRSRRLMSPLHTCCHKLVATWVDSSLVSTGTCWRYSLPKLLLQTFVLSTFTRNLLSVWTHCSIQLLKFFSTHLYLVPHHFPFLGAFWRTVLKCFNFIKYTISTWSLDVFYYSKLQEYHSIKLTYNPIQKLERSALYYVDVCMNAASM